MTVAFVGFSTSSPRPEARSPSPAYTPGSRSCMPRAVKICFWFMGVLSTGGDQLDLDLDPDGERGHLEGGAGGGRTGEEPAVHLVDGGEVGDVDQEDVRLTDVVVAEAEVAEDQADVGHHPLRLGGGITLHPGGGGRVERHMAGGEDAPA